MHCPGAGAVGEATEHNKCKGQSQVGSTGSSKDRAYLEPSMRAGLTRIETGLFFAFALLMASGLVMVRIG
jgi:hypothetical protein